MTSITRRRFLATSGTAGAPGLLGGARALGQPREISSLKKILAR